MNSQIDREIETILSHIEFPGTDAEKVRAFLERGGVADHVMEITGKEGRFSRKATLWTALTLYNLVLLLFFGSSITFSDQVLIAVGPLTEFVFVLLGLTFSGSIIGLVLSLDTTWFNRFIHRL
jgi:hypothetical protein